MIDLIILAAVFITWMFIFILGIASFMLMLLMISWGIVAMWNRLVEEIKEAWGV